MSHYKMARSMHGLSSWAPSPTPHLPGGFTPDITSTK